jgi:transposase
LYVKHKTEVVAVSTNSLENPASVTLSLDDADGVPPDQRNPEEKPALLLESKTLTDEQKGEWLRQQGLHSEHLPLWEQELTTMMNEKRANLNQENVALKKDNKRLSRELARKEKALAEAAVLLTLKKKFRNLFAGEDEET